MLSSIETDNGRKPSMDNIRSTAISNISANTNDESSSGAQQQQPNS